jgi:hypothetical protein
MSLTSCASNINGSGFPYNPSASSSVYRFNLSQGQSYNPKKSTSNFLDVSGNGITGTAYSVDGLYYPWKFGGMIHLNNTSGYVTPAGSGKTIYLNVGTSNEWTFIIAWEFVSYNGYFGSDIVAGAYANSTNDWWLGQNPSSTSPYGFFRNGVSYTLGSAPVVGRRYIAVLGNNNTTNSGYYYLFDSAGNSNSNTSIGGQPTSTAGKIALGRYGDYGFDIYMSNVYVGDAIYSNTYLSTTNALAIKDQIKYRYGISV